MLFPFFLLTFNQRFFRCDRVGIAQLRQFGVQLFFQLFGLNAIFRVVDLVLQLIGGLF
jgi:hypothetical protein